MSIILFILGFALVIKGADFLIEGSSALARKLGISSLVIGLTVVAFGTSVPELVINVFSAIEGKTDIALGNIIGSNIVNILLILGLTAIIFPLDVKFSTTWKEIPFSLFAVLLLFILTNDVLIDGTRESFLSRSDGIILFAFFGIFLYYVVEMAMRHREEISLEEPKEKKEEKEYKWYHMTLLIVAGLVMLFFGGRWVVGGAVDIAKALGLSEFVCSVVILAVGSSLPELVTSLVAAYKKEPDLSVGNIIGSNIFNIFWILGITAIIRPVPVTLGLNIHTIFLMVITLYLFLFMFVGKKYKLERWQGILFMIMYMLYIVYLFMQRG